ncbi:MAG: hypothetical protein WD200_00050 [Candidatus Andersenbacteria bacterium]
MSNKKKISLAINKQTIVRVVAGVRRRLQRLPESVLIHHNKAVELFILALFAAGSIYVTVSLLYLKQDSQTVVPQRTELAASAIDELELWLEDRQTAHENPPSFPSRVLQFQ